MSLAFATLLIVGAGTLVGDINKLGDSFETSLSAPPAVLPDKKD
jgi:hypothetical protein